VAGTLTKAFCTHSLDNYRRCQGTASRLIHSYSFDLEQRRLVAKHAAKSITAFFLSLITEIGRG
jgi:hypothetical protein